MQNVSTKILMLTLVVLVVSMNLKSKKSQSRYNLCFECCQLSRLEAIGKRIDKTEEHIYGKSDGYSGGVRSSGVNFSSSKSAADYSDAEDDAFIPSTKFLKSSHSILHPVDQRLEELVAINQKGMFKSQWGGTEQISVKYQVPWPRKFVLA